MPDTDHPIARPRLRRSISILPALVLLALLIWLERWEYRNFASALGAVGPGPLHTIYIRHAILRWGVEGFALLLVLAGSFTLTGLWNDRSKARRRATELSILDGALFNTLGALLMVVDRQGRIVRFNRAAQEFTGYTLSDVRNIPFFWTRFLPKERLEDILEVFRRLCDAEDVPTHENAWVDHAGDSHTFVWHNSVLRDDVGHVRYVITLGVDITASRRAQDQQREVETRYRNLVENSPDAVFLVDPTGRFELVNGSCAAMLGASEPHDLIGREVIGFIAASSRGQVARRVRQLREQGGSAPATIIRMQRMDGSEIEVDSVATAFSAQGATHIHVIQRNLSERRRLEREIVEVATAEQERIGREIHDGIGQRLTALSLLSAGLARSLMLEGHRKAADAAALLLGELETAIGEARSLARGLSPIELDGSSLAGAVESLVEVAGKATGVACSFTLCGDVSHFDQASATHLYRIVQEALNNALKHSHARHIAVELASDADQVRLQVYDDGRGIAASPQDGMGMSIMRRRADLIGAQLEVVSAPGSGTIVRCTCPARD